MLVCIAGENERDRERETAVAGTIGWPALPVDSATNEKIVQQKPSHLYVGLSSIFVRTADMPPDNGRLLISTPHTLGPHHPLIRFRVLLQGQDEFPQHKLLGVHSIARCRCRLLVVAGAASGGPTPPAGYRSGFAEAKRRPPGCNNMILAEASPGSG